MISVDPGEHCFYGLFNTYGVLLSCGSYWDEVRRSGCFAQNEGLVIEEQVVRRGKVIVRKGRRILVQIDPSAIITLAQYAGAIARDFGWPENEDHVQWVRPETWKHQAPKPALASQWASYAIQRLVTAALSPAELAIYLRVLERLPAGRRHDLADAVGIGLWKLNRLYSGNPVEVEHDPRWDSKFTKP